MDSGLDGSYWSSSAGEGRRRAARSATPTTTPTTTTTSKKSAAKRKAPKQDAADGSNRAVKLSKTATATEPEASSSVSAKDESSTTESTSTSTPTSTTVPTPAPAAAEIEVPDLEHWYGLHLLSWQPCEKLLTHKSSRSSCRVVRKALAGNSDSHTFEQVANKARAAGLELSTPQLERVLAHLENQEMLMYRNGVVYLI